MNWSETTASMCRYGGNAAVIFGEADIIWEHSVDDYQGFANVLARLPDGRFAHYEWTYGSCSGCDEWEARELSDEQIEAEMQFATAFFESADVLRKYLRLEDTGRPYPTANSPTNGSIPGMLRYWGGISDDFQAMGEAFLEWEKARAT